MTKVWLADDCPCEELQSIGPYVWVVNTAGQITTNPVTKGPAYKWRLADFDAMHEYLSCVDWQSVVYHHPSALDACSVFIDVINIAVSLFVPKCKAASPQPQADLDIILIHYVN